MVQRLANLNRESLARGLWGLTPGGIKKAAVYERAGSRIRPKVYDCVNEREMCVVWGEVWKGGSGMCVKDLERSWIYLFHFPNTLRVLTMDQVIL